MSSLIPLRLWTLPRGPNPFKVAIILRELSLPYVNEELPWAAIRQKPYTDLNPNGRVPALEDPNTGIKVWESGAIVRYLVETYDKEYKLTYDEKGKDGVRLKWELAQWLAFQISGQGPYFGQASWFALAHSEKLPSAIERYHKETHRVIGVLDSHLAKQGKPYLVGDRVTYVDLAFVMWNYNLPIFMKRGDSAWDDNQYPHFQEWNNGLRARPAVKEVLSEYQKGLDETFRPNLNSKS